MNNFFPGVVMAFREGLEAFLILVLIFKFLEKSNQKKLKISVIYGLISSILLSLLFGFILYSIRDLFSKMEAIGKLWESIASILAVGLVTTLIIWMINHSGEIKKHVEARASLALSSIGIFILSLVLIAREGVEIVLFAFAGEYSIISIIVGIILAAIVSIAIYFSLFKANISKILQLTLIYLIIQAGYLIGYGLHEGLSALKELGYIENGNIMLIKLFDLSETVLNHKEGIIGLPFNILFGWYSKPEWIQFIIQYLFTFSLFFYWFKKRARINIR